MAVQAPDSPPAHTTPSQASEGLSPPPPGVDGPSAVYTQPSEAPQIPVEDPALRQDPSFRDTQDDPPVTTPYFDAFEPSYQFSGLYRVPDPGPSYSLWPYTNNNIEHPWLNDFEAGQSELSLPITQLRRSKRALTLSPAPKSSSKRRKDMATEVQKLNPTTRLKPKRIFHCPFRKVQPSLGLPYTCGSAPATTMSAVRTHLTRNLPKKEPPHLPFLKLCKTCNEDILDEYEFETFHGANGLKCEIPQSQRKGDVGQQEQYDILCSKVETFLVARCTTESVQRMGATEALEQDSPSLNTAASTDGVQNRSSDVAKAAYQLPRQSHHRDLVILDGLASTRRTPSPVRSPESSTSCPSSNRKIAVPYHMRYDISLVQNMSREEPAALDDYTDHDDLMLIDSINREDRMVIDPTNDHATPRNVTSSSGISLPPIRQLFSCSMEPQEYATHRLGYLPAYAEDYSALPSPFPIFDDIGSIHDTTPCTSSTMTSISEPDSDLTPALRPAIGIGDYILLDGHGWIPYHNEPSSSAHVIDYPGSRSSDFEGPPERSDVSSQPSNGVANLMDRCNKCDKVFTGRYRKGNLRRHVLASHKSLASATATTCRVCQKDFKRTDATRKHEWKNHRLPDAKPKKRKEPWSGPIVQ